MLILDTCTLLWLVADQKKLSLKATKAIERHQGALFISAISAFEIALKSRNHKLTLPLPVEQWFAQVLDFHGIEEIPITAAMAILSAELPILHQDPCDRIIIATAKTHGMTIVSPDELIAQYKVSIVW